jgi:aryl-alcohol dehydrogenase-like predicted oxidoreductase
MEYMRLGLSGTKFSRICAGCITFGEPAAADIFGRCRCTTPRRRLTGRPTSARRRLRNDAELPMAQVPQYLAVMAPIVGTSMPQQVDEAVAALQVRLTPDDVMLLEAPYGPDSIVGQ